MLLTNFLLFASLLLGMVDMETISLQKGVVTLNSSVNCEDAKPKFLVLAGKIQVLSCGSFYGVFQAQTPPRQCFRASLFSKL
jgi:hypothetical protein